MGLLALGEGPFGCCCPNVVNADTALLGEVFLSDEMGEECTGCRLSPKGEGVAIRAVGVAE